MPCRVYTGYGIRIRGHCGTEPARDIEPFGLVSTVGGRDRASTSYAAADRVKAPAGVARRRFRGIHGGRTAPSLPAKARTASGGGYVAGSVSPLLVRSRRCSRTPPRPHGSRSINTNENENKEKTARPKPRTRERSKEMKIKLTSVYVNDQGESPALLYRGARLREEDRLRPGALSLAHGGLTEDPDGTELQLALNNNPAATVYQ